MLSDDAYQLLRVLLGAAASHYTVPNQCLSTLTDISEQRVRDAELDLEEAGLVKQSVVSLRVRGHALQRRSSLSNPRPIHTSKRAGGRSG